MTVLWIHAGRKADGYKATCHSHDLGEDRTGEVKFNGVNTQTAASVRARYVKVEVTGTKECPTWHYGVGHPSWFFIDEITIK